MNERPTPPSSANSASPRFNSSRTISRTRRRGEQILEVLERLQDERKQIKEKLFEMYTKMTSKDSE